VVGDGRVTIRIALGAVRRLDDRVLRFGAQLGLEGVVLNTPVDLPPESPWRVDDLVALRRRVESHGLRVEAVENTPTAHYRDAILGGPHAAEQTAAYCETVRALGAAGIPVLGFHWMANEVWRTDLRAEGRGGARVTAFDRALLATPDRPTHGRAYGENELWRGFERFTAAVLPVAEEAGVRLALHPDDPPLPSLGGVPRLFATVDGLRRALDVAPGLGLELCLGTISSMGPGAVEAMEELAAGGHVVYVHFRDVRGHVPHFEECFLGEGNVDVARAMRALVRSGFDGFLIDDHTPLLDGDPDIAADWTKSEYAYVGRAHAVGYLQGLLAAVLAERRDGVAAP
jgi:mannonate dehydratase